MNLKLPIAVDLDGTLIRSDTLVEATLLLIKLNPLYIFVIPIWILRGRLFFKQAIFDRVELDYSCLPYEHQLIDWLKTCKKDGHKIELVSATPDFIAKGVADFMGIFDGSFGSTNGINLKGSNKRDFLDQRFGKNGYIYCGNSSADLSVWDHCSQAVVINAPASIARKVAKSSDVIFEVNKNQNFLRTFLKAIRIHQWAKNVLIFIPLLLGHQINYSTISAAFLAFLSFSMCASSIYLINDLLDLSGDRIHPDKKHRPLASGQLELPWGVMLSIILVIGGISLGVVVSRGFLITLIIYLFITNFYSAILKRIPIADVLVLASLYSIRLIAGSQASGVKTSTWLLSVSMFFFLSLAFMKRVSELKLLVQLHRNSTGRRNMRVHDIHIHGRGYIIDDLQVLTSMGAASGYLSVVLYAQYISNSAIRVMYTSPDLLWYICPILLFWISRAWLITNRGNMNSDPVAFALRDRGSYLTFAAVGIIWFFAWMGA
jgi:4-hydroxybenzoate polyprenyltransferase